MSALAAAPDWASRLRVSQRRVVQSEWTKLRSLRSTRWSMLVAVLLTIALPLLGALVTDTHWAHMSASDRAGGIHSTSPSSALESRSLRSACWACS